jgi:hypothetical protein
MITNWIKHSNLQSGKYPERNSTKTVKIEAGSVGKVVDSSFSKDNLLQFVIDFDGKEVVVPYYMVNVLYPEVVK